MIDIEKLMKKVTMYKLAKMMNLRLSLTYLWKKNGRIPRWRTLEIINACAEHGIDVRDCVK